MAYVIVNCLLYINGTQMDGVISQAQATLGTLVFQRSTFGGINSKLSNVTSRLPTVPERAFLSLVFQTFFLFGYDPCYRVLSEYLTLQYYGLNSLQVNTILSAIKRKKSMDTIILSLVAAVCTFLILIYWLTK